MPKLSIPELALKKVLGEKLTMVAVGEAMSASWAEKAGIDIIGVGDSLGMTLHGHENTLKITVDQMIMHILAVRKGAPNTMTIASMPYGSYSSPEIAVSNALRMMKESGVDALKLQLGKEGTQIIKAIADAGVPIMSHVGLLPHKVHLMGGFKIQGKTAEEALNIIENAKAIEAAGAVGLEIEAIPYEVGKAVDEAVSIFTFSIGAGAAGTCQLLNGYDLLGAFDTFKPKFAKRYADISKIATNAFSEYAQEVKLGKFPDGDYTYKMELEESKRLEIALARRQAK